MATPITSSSPRLFTRSSVPRIARASTSTTSASRSTPAAAAPSIGTTSLGTPDEHSVAGTATVDPHGEATTYGLQYGTTIAYGSETTLQNIPAGQEGLQQVGSSIAALRPAEPFRG